MAKCQELSPDQVENARVGYQMAIDIWLRELEIAWVRFDAMLVANSVLVAVTGALIAAVIDPLIATQKSSSSPYAPWLGIYMIPLPVMGILLCVLWLLLTERTLDYRPLWERFALELEQKPLLKPIRIISRLKQFSKGDDVKFDLMGPSEPLRFGWLGRLRTRYAGRLVILVFFMLYFFLCVFGCVAPFLVCG